MSNKQKALGFLKLCERDEYREAYAKYVAPNFIHHNQYFKGDRESLFKAMEDSGKESPNKSIEVKRIYEDGDTVITYSQVTRKDSSLDQIAVIHIFRFENEKIAEMWDIGQAVLKNSPNQFGLF